MLAEDVDITLENLLELALGTPEIGAVNFNFLYEVISEIIKHLGISKKHARITQEVDYRLLDALQHRTSDHHPRKNVSMDSVAEAPQTTSITSPVNITDAVADSDGGTKDDVQRKDVPKEDVPKKDQSDRDVPKMNADDPEKNISKEMPAKKSSSSKTVVTKPSKSGEDIKDRRLSQVAPLPVPPTQRRSSIVHPRRSSYTGQRLSLKPGDSVNQDITIVNRSMERRESKTPAGDMWHVLNINRRVEAAEAAIQGMTNLIDTITSELDEMKNAQFTSTSACDTPDIPKVIADHPSSTIKQQDRDAVMEITTKIEKYDKELSDLKETIKGLVGQEQLKSCCTVEQVKKIMQEQLNGFKLDIAIPEPVVHKSSEVNIKKGSSQMLKKKESKDSHARLYYQDVSNKMVYLEQEINFAKERMNQLELELAKKLELSSVEGKAEQNEVEERIGGIKAEIKMLAELVQKLEDKHTVVSLEVQGLLSQQDEFSTQQKDFANAMRKLERNLEDMNDNFHRRQSGMIQNTSVHNIIDEATITKIRGTIFDLQQQHTRFQNEIDGLLQDGKNKDVKFIKMAENIKNLQETKVDKEYVKKMMNTKADLDLVENKVDRDQFDACIGEIDRNIQNVMQKMETTESSTNKTISSLQQCINTKIDQEELGKIRSYIDSRFISFKPKVPIIQKSDDAAAGSRKKLIPHCNCISCDRPVIVHTAQTGLAMPNFQALPGMKSLRPVTTFDLQTIRQSMQKSFCNGNKRRFEMAEERYKLQKELLQLCGVRDLDELAALTNRACGGVHTLIEQHRRNPGKPAMFYREDHVPFNAGERQLLETDVLGRDGHVYKGRIQSPVLPFIDTKEDVRAAPVRHIESPIIPRSSVQQSCSTTSAGGGATSGKIQTVE